MFLRELIYKFIVILLFFILVPKAGFAATFTIHPIRVFFEGGKKTEILTIKNESEKTVALQINAVKWTQNEKGEDIHSPTEDILFFPKLLEINPEEEKIIRIGSKVSRGDSEITYRMFLEEIQDNSKLETTAVRILMRVGIPIFIAPVKAAASGVIDSIELSRGSLNLEVKNEGNTHFIIKSIKAEGVDGAGKEAFVVERGGGYLLSGKSKRFAFEIPEDVCPALKIMKVHIDTDRLMMEKQIEIAGEICGP